jgi:hypothetical protein
MADNMKSSMGKAGIPNINWKFDGNFEKGTTPTLLDSTQARRVKAFIENLVFYSHFQIVTGDTPQTRFHIDFTRDNRFVFDLMIPTALIHDLNPKLGGTLLINGQQIHSNVPEFRFLQYAKEGFPIHPQNAPSATAAGFESVLRLFGWDGSPGTPYNVGLKAPAISDLSGSSSLDLDNGLVWTLPYEDGTENQVLATDGSRTLSFIDSSGFNLTVTEQDGSPSVSSVNTLKFANGTVTDDGSGVVSISNSGGGGSLTVTEQDGAPSVSSVTTIKFDNGTVTDDGSGVVSVSGGSPSVGDSSSGYVSSPSTIQFSNESVSNPSTGVARVLTGRPINLYTTGNGQKTGGPVITYTGASVGSEDYHFRAGDGMKLIANGSGATADELQLEVLKTEFSADTGVVDWRCGDRWMFVGGNGIITSTDPSSYPYGINIVVEDDVVQSVNSIAAVGNNFDINAGTGMSITGGTAAITIDADVADIQAGSGISVSESSGTYTITNTGGGGGGGSGTVTSVDITSTDGSVSISGSPITTSGTIDLSVSGGGGGSGTVTSVDITSSNGTIDTSGGPITSSGTLDVDLPYQGTSGSYTSADITVDDYGVITSVSSGGGGGGGTLFSFDDPSGNSFSVSSGDTVSYFSTDSSIAIDCSSSGSIGLSLTSTPMTSFNFDDPSGNSFTVSDSDTVSFFSTDSSITIDTSSSGSIGLSLTDTPMSSFDFEDPSGNTFTVWDNDTVSFYSTDGSITIDTAFTGQIGLSLASGPGLSSFDVYDDSGSYWTLDSNSSDFNFSSSDGFIGWDCSSSNYVDGYSGSSDERLKENIKPLEGSAEKVAALRAVEFDWTDEREIKYAKKRTGTAHDFGFIAQEVEKIVPEIVGERRNGMKTINYAKVVPLLLDVIQNLTAEVSDLKDRVTDLEHGER